MSTNAGELGDLLEEVKAALIEASELGGKPHAATRPATVAARRRLQAALRRLTLPPAGVETSDPKAGPPWQIGEP